MVQSDTDNPLHIKMLLLSGSRSGRSHRGLRSLVSYDDFHSKR